MVDEAYTKDVVIEREVANFAEVEQDREYVALMEEECRPWKPIEFPFQPSTAEIRARIGNRKVLNGNTIETPRLKIFSKVK
jgi:hypothetical protein